MAAKAPSPIYIVSGGQGLAGNNMVQTMLIQYPDNKIPVIILPEVSSGKQIYDIVVKAKAEKALITHTMVNPSLRKKINELCREKGVKMIDFLGELAGYLDGELNIRPLIHPGLYRKINQEYFERIEAIEYTLSHDDGLGPEKISDADIILTGVSRVGKTPLSVYLAMFGWKVANIPLVKGINPPEELFKANPKRVFGLYVATTQLINHRRKRMKTWKNIINDNYTDEKLVNEEMRNAMFVFKKGGFTIINVTNKPIESTANEILNLMSERFLYSGRKLIKTKNDDTE